MDDSMEKPNGLRERRLQIMELEQKKTTLTDAAEIDAINQQIDALEAEDRLEESNNVKALIDVVLNDSDDDLGPGMTEALNEDEKMFYELAEQGANIPPYQAMRLLGILALDKDKANKGQRKVAFWAGSYWLQEYVKNDHLKRFEKINFVDMMRFLCPEYGKEYWDAFDLVSIDDEATDKYTYQLMQAVDLETAQALCRGIWLGNL